MIAFFIPSPSPSARRQLFFSPIRINYLGKGSTWGISTPLPNPPPLLGSLQHRHRSILHLHQTTGHRHHRPCSIHGLTSRYGPAQLVWAGPLALDRNGNGIPWARTSINSSNSYWAFTWAIQVSPLPLPRHGPRRHRPLGTNNASSSQSASTLIRCHRPTRRPLSFRLVGRLRPPLQLLQLSPARRFLEPLEHASPPSPHRRHHRRSPHPRRKMRAKMEQSHHHTALSRPLRDRPLCGPPLFPIPPSVLDDLILIPNPWIPSNLFCV